MTSSPTRSGAVTSWASCSAAGAWQRFVVLLITGLVDPSRSSSCVPTSLPIQRFRHGFAARLSRLPA